MSMESRCTIGAMASKKASAPSPVSRPIASASAVRGQRAGRDDHIVPILGRKPRDLAALERDERMGEDRRLDGFREAVAIDGERAAGRHLMGVGACDHDRAQRAHLAMEDADGVGRGIVGAERIGADEFGEVGGLVRRGRPDRTHLVQYDRDAGLRRLPRGFRAGQPAADDMNGTHPRLVTKPRRSVNPAGGTSKRQRPPREPLSFVPSAPLRRRFIRALRRPGHDGR